MSFAPNATAAVPRRFDWKFAGRALLLPCLKWAALGVVARVLMLLGPRTRLGAGLVGVIFPFLVVEAWITARRHWRIRLFNTIGFAVPSCTLLVFGSVLPASCCFCDHGPASKFLRTLDFLSEFLFFNATAILPAVVLLAVLRRPAASLRENAAYRMATIHTVLATVTATLPFSGLFYALKAQHMLLP